VAAMAAQISGVAGGRWVHRKTRVGQAGGRKAGWDGAKCEAKPQALAKMFAEVSTPLPCWPPII
ncbi:MAG: hypothetical protein ACK4TI_00420, partial [Nitrososphaerales archaeon]